MKLSIIIPYYNVAQYTDELLDCLAPQITDDVEVILVDDGSDVPYKTKYEWCKIYRQKNKGVSSARNKGLELSQGKYITFIDSDDLVSDNYVNLLFSKMPFDYLDMSWRSLPGGPQYEYRLVNSSDRLKNPSVVTRAFSRAIIGDTRFNENKQAAEDAEFINVVLKRGKNIAVITDYMYFYRTYTPNSLTKRYMSGDIDTKRIVYHYRHITADMTDLLEEIKQENKHNEVYVLTEQCDIPELNQYAKVMRPCRVRGAELRGEPYEKFSKILPPPVFDVVIYTSQKNINGIYTWIYSFCGQMHDKYSIAVIHEGMTGPMIERLVPYAYVKQNGDPIKCETLLMMKIHDNIPLNISYKKSVQIVHSPKLMDSWVLPTDRDTVIPISETVKKSWNLSSDPILNMTYGDNNILHLISATRLKTSEKGLDRMKILCRMLNQAQIPFEWECYSDIDPHINGITHKSMTPDIRSKIRNADYLVQLSDNEGFCYSIVEALEEGTAVITTPIEVLAEIDFKNNKHGYVFDFDMSGDIERLKTIPTFEYTYSNKPIEETWGCVLGEGSVKNTRPVKIRCIRRYKDVILDRYIEVGDTLTLNPRRAKEIIEAGYVEEVNSGKV